MINTESKTEFGRPPSGFRLPAGTRPGRVRLQVTRLDQSTAFYETVLGFHILGGRDSTVEIGPAGGPVLMELHEHAGRPSTGRQLGLYHYAVLLPSRPDLARFVAHLADLNVRAGMSDHGVSEAVYLSDPDGLGIEVYADRPRDTWASDRGQLQMTTSPLDVGELLRDTEGSAWSGAPEGTKIGHVHLHVRDLAEASAFYHDALGLDEMVWSYPGALFLAAGGYHHHLGINTWASRATQPAQDEARLLEWELLLPLGHTLESVSESLETKGYPVERAADSILTRDPSGTPLRILAEASGRAN